MYNIGIDGGGSGDSGVGVDILAYLMRKVASLI